jgi:hypothetical protein
MENFGKWVKERFKKDPLKVSSDEIKRDQLKIDRLASIKRDEIEDVKSEIMKKIQKGKGQSRETKINLSVELDVLENRKLQLQKAHESLMGQKRALNMLEFMVEQKKTEQVSPLAKKVFDLSVDQVSEMAGDSAVEEWMRQGKLKELEGAMGNMFGEEQISERTEERLKMWDDLEAGEIDEDEYYQNEDVKSTEKMVAKREGEV